MIAPLMEIYVPYAHAPYLTRHTGLHPRVKSFLEHRAQFVDVSGSMTDYFDLLAKIWARAKTFCIIEQDVLPTEDDLEEIETCNEHWCVCPYPGPDVIFYESLGCTKFSSKLMLQIPDLFIRVIQQLGTRYWYGGIDQGIAKVLKANGVVPHFHNQVIHLHEY